MAIEFRAAMMGKVPQGKSPMFRRVARGVTSSRVFCLRTTSTVVIASALFMKMQ